MLGLPPSMLPEVVHALETKPKPVVIWLEFQDCAGYSESFIRSTTVMPTEVLLDFISLEYHETLMAPAGEYAEESKREAMERYKGRYILVVEGSVTPNWVYCAVGGRSNAEGAGAVIAVGSCASWGGIPKADPNPTGAKPVYEVLKGKKFVNIPIGFLGLTFLVPKHAFLWKEILGFELPYMPQLVADFLAYSTLLSLFALTVHRVFNPVLKLLTGRDEYFANALIGVVLFTGLFASKWLGGGLYVWMLNLHMLSAITLIIYIPFSRLSHFVYYFLSVFFYGWQVKLAFYTCTMCDRCTKVCPMGIDTPRLVSIVRSALTSAGLIPKDLADATNTAVEKGSLPSVWTFPPS